MIIEIKVKKLRGFDWIKFVAVGIPALFIAIAPILIYRNLFFVNDLILYGNTTLTTTAGIVFGYVFIDSFKK
ncbi:hypothetical protein [Virgibacillus sp. L01]|uniref:hypothetical protein n=1 Tax=Virgibacillus sp. L01 TaxID=3457429 RepID=UPI003FD5E89F